MVNFSRALVLAGICLAAVATVGVFADDVDMQLKETVREVKISLNKNDLTYEAQSKSGFNSQLHIQATGKQENSQLFDCKYQFQGEGSTVKFQNKFRVRMFQIMEYVENSAVSNGYTQGVDQVVQNYTNIQWGNWAENTPSGASYKQFNLVSSDNVLTIKLSVTGNASATLPSGVVIDSNMAKIDILINNFPYTTAGSYLAFAARVETDADSRTEGTNEIKQVQYKLKSSGTGLDGVLIWATTVTADNATVAVIPSGFVSNNGTSKLAFFSFDTATHPAAIEWDPQVGVASSGALASAVSTIAFVLAMIAGAFLAL